MAAIETIVDARGIPERAELAHALSIEFLQAKPDAARTPLEVACETLAAIHGLKFAIEKLHTDIVQGFVSFFFRER